MKSKASLLICLAAAAISANCSFADTPTTLTDEIFYADPTIYVENGKYYLTGTRSGKPQGFALLQSVNLTDWQPVQPDSMILRKGESAYGTHGFWAPQILKHGNRHLFAYTANEQTALAAANSVTGPYTQTETAPIDGSEKNIDPFIFIDDDGRCYLYHVRFDNGNFLWVGEFDLESGKIKDGTLKPCFRNTQPWEATDAYPSAPIMEGPTVIKLDNTYYLFYSANHFMSEDYAVGYATAPTPMGPWTKNPANPIINRSIVGEKGSGHGDIFFDGDGHMRYVYHVHYSDTEVSPRRTRIINLNLEKNPATGIYSITADPSTIIKPVATH